ncbi:hypothetical protein AN476_18885 [Phaeobacter sp. 11ANDIMAR09]|nr:hypothetical protein AN476_18885 [Phaeobacter sp. 11ANDIMAR09]
MRPFQVCHAEARQILRSRTMGAVYVRRIGAMRRSTLLASLITAASGAEIICVRHMFGREQVEVRTRPHERLQDLAQFLISLAGTVSRMFTVPSGSAP